MKKRVYWDRNDADGNGKGLIEREDFSRKWHLNDT